MQRRVLMFFMVFVWMSLGIMPVLAQTNITDSQGRKQGKWIQFKDGVKFYEGNFVDDKPQGQFQRFYKSGRLMSKSEYSANGSRCFSEFFYDERKGTLKAKGLYINQVKDSLWLIYNEEGVKIAEEHYKLGVADGIWKIYSFENVLVRETPYKQGKIDGAQKEYFADGTTKRLMNFSSDTLNGEFKVYFPNQSLRIDGLFQNGIQSGDWKYFNEDGSLMFTEYYVEGIMTKRLDAAGKPFEIIETVDTVKLNIDPENYEELKID